MLKPQQFDTSLAEFTYTVARNTPLSRKRYLPDKLYQKISTEKGAMRFATRSTEQEKREFFAYMGLQNFWVIADVGFRDVDDFREIFLPFDKKEGGVNTLKKLADKNIFITSSKELVYRLGFMAQLTDTKPYSQNLELVRGSHQLLNFRPKLNNDEHNQSVAEKENSTKLLRLIFATLFINNISGETTTLDAPTIQVLMFFYLNRQTYISSEGLNDKFSGFLSPKQITSSKMRLLEGQFIQRGALSNNEFSITAIGISAVNKFRDKIVKILEW